MRFALCAAACLALVASADAFYRPSVAKAPAAAPAARAAQQMSCPDALAQVVACDPLGTGNSMCCSTYSDAALTCGGGDLYTFIGQLYQEVRSGNFSAANLQVIFELIPTCPLSAANGTTCNDNQAATCNCLSAAGSAANASTCCPLLSAAVPSCMGVQSMNNFFDLLGQHANMTGCPVFPPPLCSGAAFVFTQCVAGFGNQFNSTCCHFEDMMDTFCINQGDLAAILTDTGFPSDTQAAALNTSATCKSYKGGNGNNNGPVATWDNVCPNPTSCDGGRIAYGVYYYNGWYVSSNPGLSNAGSFAFNMNGMNYYYVMSSAGNQLSPAYECMGMF